MARVDALEMTFDLSPLLLFAVGPSISSFLSLLEGGRRGTGGEM